MKIVIQNIKNEVSQDISVDVTRRAVVGSIAPFIVMVGAPAGTFTFGIYQGATALFEESFTSNDIKEALNTINNHAYLFYPFIPNIRISSGIYTLKLTASGYAPTDTSFMAWGQQHEDIQNGLDYTPSGVSQNPLSYRIKILKEGIL